MTKVFLTQECSQLAVSIHTNRPHYRLAGSVGALMDTIQDRLAGRVGALIDTTQDTV